MISSTSSLNRYLHYVLLMLLLSGCAAKIQGPPPLKVEALKTRAEGSLARRDAVRLECVVSGGQGGVTYDFRMQKETVESQLSYGSSASLQWSPKEPGAYRYRVIATDRAGTVAASNWTHFYRFESPVGKDSLYAILPIDNLSDQKAPLQEIRDSLADALSAAGFRILDTASQEEFMRKHRIRQVGGLEPSNSQQLRDELGVDGVVITSLETWHEATPPRVALISRVVMTGKEPEIVWIDSIGLAGDDAPGLLGLGLVDSIKTLLNTAAQRLTASFKLYVAGKFPSYRYAVDGQGMQKINAGSEPADSTSVAGQDRYQPHFSFRAQNFDFGREYRVALVPFLNVNARKHAGRIIALHLVQQLNRYENIRVVEPGWVRSILLKYRMIMQSGPSLAASDVLADRNILGADLIMSGKVFNFQDAIGESKVDFSMQAFAGARREVVWTSRSYAGGNDGVYFFDKGRIRTAHDLVTPMMQATIKLLEE